MHCTLENSEARSRSAIPVVTISEKHWTFDVRRSTFNVDINAPVEEGNYWFDKNDFSRRATRAGQPVTRLQLILNSRINSVGCISLCKKMEVFWKDLTRMDCESCIRILSSGSFSIFSLNYILYCLAKNYRLYSTPWDLPNSQENLNFALCGNAKCEFSVGPLSTKNIKIGQNFANAETTPFSHFKTGTDAQWLTTLWYYDFLWLGSQHLWC